MPLDCLKPAEAVWRQLRQPQAVAVVPQRQRLPLLLAAVAAAAAVQPRRRVVGVVAAVQRRRRAVEVVAAAPRRQRMLPLVAVVVAGYFRLDLERMGPAVDRGQTWVWLERARPMLQEAGVAAAVACHRPLAAAGAVQPAERHRLAEVAVEAEHLSRPPVVEVAEGVCRRPPRWVVAEAEEAAHPLLQRGEEEVEAERVPLPVSGPLELLEGGEGGQRPLRRSEGEVRVAGDPRTTGGAVRVAGDPRTTRGAVRAVEGLRSPPARARGVPQ